jgi:hypothetical protein
MSENTGRPSLEIIAEDAAIYGSHQFAYGSLQWALTQYR